MTAAEIPMPDDLPPDDDDTPNRIALVDPDGGAMSIEEHRGQLRFAERVVTEHSNTMRHVHGIGWHIWDGARWAPDKNGAPARKVIDTMKAALYEAIGLDKADRDALMKDVRRNESASGVDGTLSLAGRMLPISISHDVLDANPALFNLPSATLDLTSTQRLPHNRADHISRVAAADPGDTGAEIWAAFLARVLPDDDVRSFVQRLIGYSMLGQVREHVMPIFTGTGANGKGTFRDAVLHAFGDYAHEVGPELLMESKHPRHGTFKMQLRGRRLVFCSETQQGARFDAETMKRLVGGDPIEANLMRRDPITFLPSHTLIMLTNHLPVISGEDEAVWRRVLVVPFHVVIPEDERDPGLSQELKAAAPAVMAWAAAGWREYQRIGLAAPDAVRASTDAYREDSDQLGRFLAERCIPGPRMHVGARDLYHAYTAWCSAVGERTAGEKDFAKSMAAKGMEKRKTGSGLRYWGVGLEDDTPEGDTPGRDR